MFIFCTTAGNVPGLLTGSTSLLRLFSSNHKNINIYFFMSSPSKKQLLDYIPLTILIISATVSWIQMLTSNTILQWQHYLGILFLIINAFVFFKNHKAGVLFSGLALILALIGIISFNVGIIESSLYWTISDIKIPLSFGNPIIIIWLILHIILSGKYYFGILTKQYWRTFLSQKL